MGRPKTDYSDEHLYRVAWMLLEEGKTADEIARELQKEIKNFNRQTVYKSLKLALDRKILKLVSPIDATLRNQICEEFSIDQDRVQVVKTTDKSQGIQVSAAAAELVLEKIRKLQLMHGPSRPIRLGLGPGRGTRDFAEALGGLLRFESGLNPIDLYAIAAGCPATSPEYSSPSFFNLFPQEMIRAKVGLFAESIVQVRHFTEQMKERPGLREAFAVKKQVDIIVTSMGLLEDKHDLFHELLDADSIKKLDERGVIGNVQYRPFTKNGPLQEELDDWRAVTVFELEDFVEIVKAGHQSIVMIARQCGACGKSRAAGLRPLLREPSLRVFTDLVMDSLTAKELVQPPEPSQVASQSGATSITRIDSAGPNERGVRPGGPAVTDKPASRKGKKKIDRK